MPYTLNGFGTKFYGKREQAADGSYVTTKWVTALYVPLVPVGSYRVLPVGQGTNWGIHRSQNYQVMPVPLCWDQVWNIYMIAAPILILLSWFVWSEVKKDQAQDTLHAHMQAVGAEIEAQQAATDKLETACLEMLKGSGPGVKVVKQDLHDRCAPLIPAVDAYTAKVERMQKTIAAALSGTTLPENDRSALNTYQTIWNIRRHQADETKQIALCLEDISRDCYTGLASITKAMDAEDKQACSLLATVNQKCE
jgi:hypothetical protein